jgi:hypothetical protein
MAMALPPFIEMVKKYKDHVVTWVVGAFFPEEDENGAAYHWKMREE